MHFDNNLDLLDLFLPINMSSSSRARAFLWLCYHYLESSDNSTNQRNPFDDPHVPHPHKIPPLVTLTPEEMEQENIDTEEELLWAERMTLQRKDFQAKLDKGKDKQEVESNPASVQGAESVTAKGKVAVKSAKDIASAKATAKEKKAATDKARRERQKKAKEAAMLALGATEADDLSERELYMSIIFFLSFKACYKLAAIPKVQHSQEYERQHPRESRQRRRSPSQSTAPSRHLRSSSPRLSYHTSPWRPNSTSSRSANPHSVASDPHLYAHKPRSGRVSPPRTMLQRTSMLRIRLLT